MDIIEDACSILFLLAFSYLESLKIIIKQVTMVDISSQSPLLVLFRSILRAEMMQEFVQRLAV